jgi:glycosyltransferase involved in cell wall biosynthesis
MDAQADTDVPPPAFESIPPRVSIGLPVFNGMPYLKGALASLLAQDEVDIEIVISDNASEDDTEAHCRAVAERDQRVRYSRNPENLGGAANFQRVLALSTAPFFAWAAHDDIYAPTFVSRCLGVLESRAEAALCVPAHRRIDDHGAVISIRQEPAELSSLDLKTRLRAHLSRRAWLTIYGLWRKDILTKIGPPLPVWGSDVILVWRALLLAPIETITDPLADYRVFREKTADATMFGITGAESRLHFPNTQMLGELKKASDGLDLSETDRRIAADVLRRWIVSRNYRQLAFADLWLESRRQWSEGTRLRALALLPPMAVLSPGMSVNGARQAYNRYRGRSGKS